MKIGVFGDIHFPWRARIDYRWGIEVLKEERIKTVIVTGDYGDIKVIEDIYNNFEEKYMVRGNTDRLAFESYNIKDEIVLEIEGFKIFVFHSDKVYPRGDIYKIYKIGRENKADIVIFGHTHVPMFTYLDGVYLLNPGSLTGSRSGEGIVPPASLAILDIKKDEVRVNFVIKHIL